MKDKDQIKELFSEKLGNYEAKVNPQLWSNIASQVAVQSTTAVVGVSIVSKIIIGAIAAASVIGLFVYSLSSTEIVDETIENTNVLVEQKSIKKESEIAQPKTADSEVKKPSTVSLENTNSEVDIESTTPIIDSVTEIIKEVNLTNVLSEEHEEIEPLIKEETKEALLVEENIKETIEIQNETIEEELEVTPAYSIDKLPNTFSPNNDGQNDYFFIKNTGLKDFNLVVLDDKNRTIYQSSNPDFNWDGITLSGSMVPSGRYVYFITALDKEGNPINKYNSLTILR